VTDFDKEIKLSVAVKKLQYLTCNKNQEKEKLEILTLIKEVKRAILEDINQQIKNYEFTD